MSQTQILLARINFDAREAHYHHVETICEESLRQTPNDAILLFWRAFAVLMQGRGGEAMNMFSYLNNKREVGYASTIAQLHYHEHTQQPDPETIATLQARVEMEDTTATEQDFLMAGLFYWHTKDPVKARECVKKALDKEPSFMPAVVLRGWLDLGTEGVSMDRTMLSFDAALAPPASGAAGLGASLRSSVAATAGVTAEKGPRKDLEALLGKAACFVKFKLYPQAIDVLNQASVLFPAFPPVFVEKMRVLAVMNEWEQAVDVAQTLLKADSRNIHALHMLSVYLLARDPKPTLAAQRVAALTEAVVRGEPNHPNLYVQIERPLVRLAGRMANPVVLQHCLQLMRRASEIDARHAGALNEAALTLYMMGDVAGAQQQYANAAQVDDANVEALYGLIRCHIVQNNLEEAAHLVEFLSEIQSSLGSSGAEFAELQALLHWKISRDRATAIAQLGEAAAAHLRPFQGGDDQPVMGPDFFVALNPEFLLEITRELLGHCSSTPLQKDQAVPPLLNQVISILEILARFVPALLESQLLLARAQYLAGRWADAQKLLTDCLQNHPACSDGHVLLARIHYESGDYPSALSALEQALSTNFRVRDNTSYVLIKAQIHERMGEWQQAKQLLTHAMTLPGSTEPVAVVPLADRAGIFVELAAVHAKLEEWADATRLLNEATHEFKDSPEEVLVTIASADLALARRDFDGAASLLKSVSKDSPHYMRSLLKLADIYLTNRNDKNGFIMCFRDVATQFPSAANYTMLGDAYLRIQEAQNNIFSPSRAGAPIAMAVQPEQAIKSFEEAIKLNPTDTSLASKIGKALITTHDYAKAISYYEAAVRASPGQHHLRQELAQLYIFLKNYSQAEAVLNLNLDGAGAHEGEGEYSASLLERMMSTVQTSILLAEVYKGNGATDEAINVLSKARDTHGKVLLRLKMSGRPETYQQQRSIAAKIAYTMATYYHAKKDLDKANQFYLETLRHDETHEKCLLSLARLALGAGRQDACEERCESLIRINAANEEALLMLADLKMQKKEYAEATTRFRALLDRRPNHYSALSKLIQLLFRAGQVEQSATYISAAEASSSTSQHSPGLHFCKGLFNRFRYQPQEALEEFNQARKDPEWSERAIMQMVRIYMGNELDQQFDEQGQCEHVDNTENIRSCEQLLREIADAARKPDVVVISCYVQMATETKADVEAAQRRLNELLAADREYVPGMLAMAHSFMILKQVPKARNLLKPITKMALNPIWFEEFERAYLMLADIYIAVRESRKAGAHRQRSSVAITCQERRDASKKLDLAQDLCERCIGFNKSCARAYESLGLIYEREQSYQDAATHYETAWKLQKETSPSIGFKLAFNYLKAQRFIPAIDVCHKVLSQYPQYPRMKKEILDRARMSVRIPLDSEQQR